MNLWHGMPVKRLDDRPAVARHQTDLLTVTSALHARNIQGDWGVPLEACREIGLPRNDVLVRAKEAATQPSPSRLVARMPTYRRSVLGHIRDDGHEMGNVFQLPGATPDAIEERAKDLGLKVIVKLHPMAERPARPFQGTHLEILDDADLAERGLSVYGLLAQADVLVTDHSSVWIDYLLMDRPLVFSIADLAAYSSTRGHYFTPLEDALPGPVVSSVNDLFLALKGSFLDDEDQARWRARRAESTPIHHRFIDSSSSERVAAEIEAKSVRRS